MSSRKHRFHYKGLVISCEDPQILQRIRCDTERHVLTIFEMKKSERTMFIEPTVHRLEAYHRYLSKLFSLKYNGETSFDYVSLLSAKDMIVIDGHVVKGWEFAEVWMSCIHELLETEALVDDISKGTGIEIA